MASEPEEALLADEPDAAAAAAAPPSAGDDAAPRGARRCWPSMPVGVRRRHARAPRARGGRLRGGRPRRRAGRPRGRGAGAAARWRSATRRTWSRGWRRRSRRRSGRSSAGCGCATSRRADRLDELAFELPLVGGDDPTGRLTLERDRRACCASTSRPGDPLGGYADAARRTRPAPRRARLPDRQHRPRRPRARRARFAVVDYKTNWLGAPGEPLTAWHHRPAALAAEMERAHYALQALLYTVALHRYLRWRLPGYDPDAQPRRRALPVPARDDRGRHAAVDGAPCGVFAWRPPGALVVALSDVLDRGAPHERARRARPVRRPPRAARARRCCGRSTRRACSPRPTSTSRGAWRARRRGRRGRRARRRAGRARAAARARLRRPRDDRATRRSSTSSEPVDLAALPWPEAEGWAARLAASRARGADGPLRLRGHAALYLDRYWREERQVAADLRAFAGRGAADSTRRCSPTASDRLFGARRRRAPAPRPPSRRVAPPARGRRRRAGHGQDDDGRADRRAARRAGRRGGAAPPPLIALAAPTGKAAARLEEAVHDEARRLDVGDDVAGARCSRSSASTLHRLLGWRPGSHSRFRHHRGNRLPARRRRSSTRPRWSRCR